MNGQKSKKIFNKGFKINEKIKLEVYFPVLNFKFYKF